MTPDPTEKAIVEFREKFRATGAEIISFKRHEYFQLREHQYQQAEAFLRTALKQAREECKEEKMQVLLKTRDVAIKEGFELGKNAAADHFQKHVIDIPDHAKFYGMKSIVHSVRSLPLPTND